MKVWLAHEDDWDYGAHIAVAATLERAKRAVEEHSTWKASWTQEQTGDWRYDTYSVWEEEVLE